MTRGMLALLLVLLGAWAFTMLLVWALLSVCKDADEAMERLTEDWPFRH